jgi:hypothetical protein
MNPFACLSPVKDLQYFLCLVIVQSLIAFLATRVEMPQAGSGPGVYAYSCEANLISVRIGPVWAVLYLKFKFKSIYFPKNIKYIIYLLLLFETFFM